MRIGLCVPISERGAEPRALPYSDMRALAVAAEQTGLDSIWVADHLFIEGGNGTVRGAWESVAIMGALADATSRVELGQLVLCTPFRKPGVIAWMANTLDEISGGRFVLGLGSGWHEPEFEAFGFEFGRRVTVFEESLNVIVPLLRDGHVAYQGEFVKGEATLRPSGPRAGGPPIMIACSRPRMMSLTARWANRWNSVWYGLPTDEFRDERERLSEACDAIGRDPAEIEVSVGVQIHDARGIDDNSPEALAGSVERLAEGFAAWRDEGVDEIMCRLEPPSLEIVDRIARAAELVRAEASPA